MNHRFSFQLLLICCCFIFSNVACAADAEIAWESMWEKYQISKSKINNASETLEIAKGLLKISSSDDLRINSHSMQMLEISEFLKANKELKLALEITQRALLIFEKNLGQESPYVARSLHILAEIYDDLWQSDTALPLRIRVVDITEKSLGAKDIRTALMLNNLAKTYNKLSRYERAIQLQLRAIEISELDSEKNSLETATFLKDIGENYYELGNYEIAHSFFSRALEIRQNKLGIEHIETAKIHSNIAAIHFAKGNYSDALSLNLFALAVIEKNLGTNSLEAIDIKSNIASTYAALGLVEKALVIQETVYLNIEKEKGINHPAVAISLAKLAELHSELGDFDLALSLKLRSVDILENSLGTQHHLTGLVLNDTANTYNLLADYEKSLLLFNRSLEIAKLRLGNSHPDVATIIGNISLAYYYLGQYETSLMLGKQSLDMLRLFYRPDHPEIARNLNNLALIYFRMGNFTEAQKLQEQAVKIYEDNFTSNNVYFAAGIAALANIYRVSGQYEKSLQLSLIALNIREKLRGPHHIETAHSLNSVAWAYNDSKQHALAVEKQLDALTIASSELGPAHPTTALFMAHLGIFETELSQQDIRIFWLKQAVNSLQLQRAKVSKIGSDNLKSYTDSIQLVYQTLANSLTNSGRLSEAQQVLDMLKEEEQFDLIRRSASADPRKTRMGYTYSEQQWVNRYNEIANHLSALGVEDRELKKVAKISELNPAQRQRQKELVSDLLVARHAFHNYLVNLQTTFSTNGISRAVEKEETSLQAMRELQNLIGGLADSTGSGVALLQYFITEDQISILMTSPGVQLARTSNIKSSELNRLIGDFRRQLRDPRSQPLKTSQTLYKLLVEPIAADLDQAGIQTVMLSLDGSLRYLPFSALHDGKQFLVQRWRLPIYTSVARKSLKDNVSKQWQAAGLGLTKAISDFPALPAVRTELRSIIKTNSRAENGVLPGKVYLDEDFNSESLKTVGQGGFELLHIASHFRFSPGTEINSYLLLGNGKKLTLGDLRTQNFRFDQVDLLTLSACDTGLGGGRDENGREIEGFGVIAQQQGAKAVLATLWPVADSSTAELMTDLYRRRQTLGLNKAEALRQAQEVMLQGKYSHPFYWAPFILMGNWK